MEIFFFFLSLIFLWFIRTTKTILFWLYLWQLKEYHIGRFLAHFQTWKGKQLLLNKIVLSKIFLFCLALFFHFRWEEFNVIKDVFIIFSSFYLLILYFVESVKAFVDYLQKRFKKPIWTKKTVFLISIALILEIFFFSVLVFGNINLLLTMLAFDISTPLIASVIVLIFQPLTILWRNQLIQKAKLKMEKLKDVLVIGITGSYGKTSTKEFLATILSEKFNVLKTKEHQNSEAGISQCILNDLKPEYDIFVVEMGAYNRGGIKLLCDIVNPKIGILTGINEQHMATFGSQENIIWTKYELIESLPEDGLAIFNGSDSRVLSLYLKTKKPKKVYRYRATRDGVEPDIFAKDILIKKEILSFRALMKNKKSQDFKINLLGAQHVGNILAAILVARELGMTLEGIAKACHKIKPEKGTIQLRKGMEGINILDSTYSANPDGVLADLDYLRVWPGKKIIVMPCLIELGKASEEVHKKIGGKIGEICDMAIITTKEKFREIKEEAVKNGMKKENILFLENPQEIIERIKIFSKKDDVVLFESRVPKKLFEELINR